MNIFHCKPKTVTTPGVSSLSPGSGLLYRTIPTLLLSVVLAVLATGWGIGVTEVYADSKDFYVIQDNDDAEEDTCMFLDKIDSEYIKSLYLGFRESIIFPIIFIFP